MIWYLTFLSWYVYVSASLNGSVGCRLRFWSTRGTTFRCSSSFWSSLISSSYFLYWFLIFSYFTKNRDFFWSIYFLSVSCLTCSSILVFCFFIWTSLTYSNNSCFWSLACINFVFISKYLSTHSPSRVLFACYCCWSFFDFSCAFMHCWLKSEILLLIYLAMMLKAPCSALSSSPSGCLDYCFWCSGPWSNRYFKAWATSFLSCVGLLISESWPGCTWVTACFPH